MKVIELLNELEEIVDTSPNFPLSTKIVIEADDILSIVKDIRRDLPEEIQKAQWITSEQERILEKAKSEYTDIINEAKKEAEALIETDDITMKARKRAEEILRAADEGSKNLKLSTIEYIDGLLYDFQTKMDSLNVTYFQEMYNNVQNTFDQVEGTVNQNRSELKELLHRAEDGEV